MNVFKKLLDFYIESSLHVALAIYALIRITFIKLNIPYDEAVAYFGFYGTVVGYNFIKYDELARVKKIKLSPNFKAIITVSFISFWLCLYYFFQLQPITKLFGFVGLFVAVLYTLPFIPNKPNMRNWAGIKIYLVAIAWVLVTVILPVLNSEYDFNSVVIIKSVQRFILVFVLMLIFEIIDLKNDEHYLQTIPQKIGESTTKKLTYVLLIFFVLLDFFKPNVSSKDLLIIGLVAFCISVFTFFATAQKSKYYTSFWVESVPILWFLITTFF